MKSHGPDAIKVLIRGAGDLASGVAWRLYHCGFRLLMTEVPTPLAVRRKVSFCEAVYEGKTEVEGVRAALVRSSEEITPVWDRGEVPIMVDPEGIIKNTMRPHVLVDAIIAKRNLGTTIHDAPLVIALGPGFEAGRDAHFVVETHRGHHLGRLLTSGAAEPDTGVPGPVKGFTTDRVLRAPAEGIWVSDLDIGDSVKPGDRVGTVEGRMLQAKIPGVIRGLIRRGVKVREGLKIGDIDPRGNVDFCFTVSEKALAIAGGVLEGIMRVYGRKAM